MTTPPSLDRAPEPSAIETSIIIVTYGQRALTEQCLTSLERCLGDRLGRTWEIVIVDNDSPDDTAELLGAWSDRATVDLLEENRNFAGGCNHGATLARGDVLLFLNNDTEALDGALETVAAQAREPGVAAAGCRLLYPDGTLQHAGVLFLRGAALGGAAMGQHILHHQDSEVAMGSAIYETDCCTAACLAVRADVFAALGGFDEGYVNGLEDVDLCLRLREAGHRIVYRGDATLIHHEGASRGQAAELWATPEKAARMAHNDQRFVGRWAAKLEQDDELAALVWDGRLEDRALLRDVSDIGDVLLVGQPGGIGPSADEARALLLTLEACSHRPATFDLPHPNLGARAGGPAGAAAGAARRRAFAEGVLCIHLPTGPHDPPFAAAPATIYRLPCAQTRAPLQHALAVWCPSPAVATALFGAGIPAERLRVVPPTIVPRPVGAGGAGVLVHLPVHIPQLSALILDALAGLPGRVAVTLVPSTHIRGLGRELHARLPRAELLAPCSDEWRWAALAEQADAVVAIDPWDRFDRRLLVAAAAGAAVLDMTPAGPAAHVLEGLDGVARATTAPRLGDRILAALEDWPGRTDVAAVVQRRCGPEAVALTIAGSAVALA